MIHLRLTVKDPVCDADYWIIIPVGVRIYVATERVWDVHLLLVLDVQHKLLLYQALFEQDRLQVEHVLQLADAQHELYLIQFVFHNLPVEFVLQKHAVRSLLVHIDLRVLVLVDFRLQVDVVALRFVGENKQVTFVQLFLLSVNAERAPCIYQFTPLQFTLIHTVFFVLLVIIVTNVLLKKNVNALLVNLIKLVDAAHA